MAFERVGPEVVLPGGVVAVESVGPSFPPRFRIVEAMRAVDDALAGDPDAGLRPVPGKAVVRATWDQLDQGCVSEVEVTVCNGSHLQTLLDVAMAYLARGEEPIKQITPPSPEAPHGN